MTQVPFSEKCIATLEKIDQVLTLMQKYDASEVDELLELIRTTQKNLDIPFIVAAIKDQLRTTEQEKDTILWQCPNCNQETSAKEWLCCCSRECLKMWLDKNTNSQAEYKR